jgi:hypothetical protein
MKNSNKFADTQQTCIRPSVGRKVYDYYNGALSGEEAGGFERHLIKCHYCEKIILELDCILAALSGEKSFDSTVKNEGQHKAGRSPPPLKRGRKRRWRSR